MKKKNIFIRFAGCLLFAIFFQACSKNFSLSPNAPLGAPADTFTPTGTVGTMFLTSTVPTATNSQTPVISLTCTLTPSSPVYSPTPQITSTSTATFTTTSTLTFTPVSTPTFTPTYGHYSWAKAAASSPMGARMFAGNLVYNGKMWIVAGGSPCVVEGWFKSDVWSSTEGASWTRATGTAAFGVREAAGCVVFNNKMWLIGGDNGYSCFNDVWSSTDGANWTSVLSNAPFSARSSFGCVVFNNKIWVIGGDQVDGQNPQADIWCSSDGVNWNLAGNLPDSRGEFGCVVYNGSIWIIAGHDYGYLLNDVWSSADGINWNEITAGAPFGDRTWAATTVFNGSIWVVGGANSNAWNYISSTYTDAWSSYDGVNWTQPPTSTPFYPRFGAESLVYNNELWMIGGAWFANPSQVWNGVGVSGALYLKDIWHTQ